MNNLQSLSLVFQNKLFRIPDYQRGYAWKDEQLLDFWEDLDNLQPGRNHYTGLLSIKELTGKSRDASIGDDRWLVENGYRVYHIVDGQQRLTTFVILLNELVSFARKAEENKGKPETDIYLGYENLREIKKKFLWQKKPPNEFIISYIFGYEKDNPSAEYLKYRVFEEEHAGTVQETYYTKNLKHAKAFFAGRIQDLYNEKGMDGLVDIYRKITLRLMFNIHEIEDDYDVYVAFETMNNRGKKLTNLELLKNRLIYLTTLYDTDTLPLADADALREKINTAWKEVYFQLGRNEKEPLSDDDFLRAHWIIYFAYTRKKGDDYIQFLLRKFSHKAIYTNVAKPQDDLVEETDDPEYEVETEESFEPGPVVPDSNAFLTPKEIADYVDSLNETAQYWYYSFFPEQYPMLSMEERLWIDRLNRVGIGYFRPLVAVSLMPGVSTSAQERVALYRAIERFIFVCFRMAMYQSSYKSSDYYRKTRELYRKEISLGLITNDLNDVVDKDTDAVKVFLSRMNNRFNTADGFYSWRDLRYFLFEYEAVLAEKHKIQKLDWMILSKVVKDKITVEHILPQTPTKYYWRNQFRQFTDDEKMILAASLGNLLPLSQSINSKLQNDSFDEKKMRGYFNGCHSEIEVAKEDCWTAEKIFDRGMKLLGFMEHRWGIHFADEEQKEELLHIGFVHDGREVPEELPLEKAVMKTEKLINKTEQHPLSSLQEKYLQYWTYALPIIREAHGGEGHPFANAKPNGGHYKDGFFGVKGVHVYCGIRTRKPCRCTVGLWIGTGVNKVDKQIFDYLYTQKEEIENRVSMPIRWNRNDENHSSGLGFWLDNVNVSNPNDWAEAASFHARMSKEMADAAFYPYKEIICELLSNIESQ